MIWMSCNCGRGSIGFDEGSWTSITGCDPTRTFVPNIAADLTLLADCTVLFAGNDNICGNAIRFASPDWGTISTWIHNGGRMFIAAEHSGDFPGGNTSFKCLQDIANLNSFLGSMSSTLTYIGQDWLANGNADPGTAAIAHAGELAMNRFGEVAPGANGAIVWKAPVGQHGGGRSVVVAQKLGNGFLFLSGDSNLDGCPFFKRLWTDADVDMI